MNKRILLDSHAALFAVRDEAKLPSTVRQMLQDDSCHVYVSVATLWELLLKARKGKLNLGDDPAEVLKLMCQHLQADVLPITAEHVFRCTKLQGFHKDPFDRLLVAQAIAEELVLVTQDEVIPRYNVKTVW